mgnify:CR=1 FL=1
MKRIVLAMGASLASLIIGGCATQPLPYHNVSAANDIIEFAPGVVSTKEYFEINAVFNEAGDKVIFARCSDDFGTCAMMESKHKNGQWQKPETLPFSGEYLDADPYFDQKFELLYYISKRPIKKGGKETENVNLWRVAHIDGIWQTPEYMDKLSSQDMDLYPSITRNGDLYFPSFRDNKRQMYVAKANGTGFDKPTPLPTEMFGKDAKIGDSVVLRDGNTIIFSMRRPDSMGKGDLYVSHKVNGLWTLAKSLGEKVNSADHEFTPIVSPDGQYLFFTRIEQGKGNIYQISLDALSMPAP